MYHMREMFHFRRPLGLLISFISIFLICTFVSNFPEDSNSESLYNIPYPIITKSENPVNIYPENIAIVIVLSEGLGRDYYKIALDSVECYAKAHGYQFILTNDTNWGCDHLKEKSGCGKKVVSNKNEVLAVVDTRKKFLNRRKISDRVAHAQSQLNSSEKRGVRILLHSTVTE
ncbi:hypothetical protein CAEBREN_07191 [Caenorhabditis brenneri]|uniref:Uncharacterized protein n=1 Tax=Caenorhabditis brenneri TaxID=135651 RepID=G0NW97_CAEBE|nr:hypothetical protein CAEBREN_07191 [Caenorhabditis brenneri]